MQAPNTRTGIVMHAKGAALLSEDDPFMTQENLERKKT